MTTAVRPTRSQPEVTLYVGDLYAASHGVLLKTLLGSCIAVCLWDPDTSVGGMNHFMLPRGCVSQAEDSSRFGVHAMDLLIGAIMKAGGDRRRLRAKVFGGGHVLGIAEAHDSVPRQNIRFIRCFLRDEGLPLISEDVGGYEARHVYFQTNTGRAWVKRLRSPRAKVELVRTERRITAPAAPRPAYGDVTLF
jgi:chemotaxis receptor (MCP) glutamine deamidase CheD